MIAIIDYGMGNKHSVYNTLDYMGIDAIVTSDTATIRDSDRIILPGVGAFGKCMDNLRSHGLMEVLNESVIEQRKPFMGICLGMQVLADIGEEKGIHSGLGWINGKVRHLSNITTDLKIPHVGWNDIELTKDCSLFHGIARDKSFYFVHSYYFEALNIEEQIARTQYGSMFTSAVLKDNIFATQFHPEKSQKNGMILMENFSKWRPE